MALNPDGPALTPRERARLFPRHRTRAVGGYYAVPGSGPVDHTCGDCKHHETHSRTRTYHKCALVDWTFGVATDIRVRSPACQGWEKADA